MEDNTCTPLKENGKRKKEKREAKSPRKIPVREKWSVRKGGETKGKGRNKKRRKRRK